MLRDHPTGAAPGRGYARATASPGRYLYRPGLCNVTPGQL